MERIKDIALLSVIIILLLLVAGVQVNNWKLQKEVDAFEQDTTSKTITVVNNYYDSAAKEIQVPFLVPGKEIIVSVPQYVDTAEILQAYYNMVVYPQIIEDSSLRATIIDTICQNKIKSRNFSYQWLKPVKTVVNNTTTTVVKRDVFFIGGNLEYLNNRIEILPACYINTKKSWLFGAGTNLQQAIQKQPNFFISINKGFGK